MCATTLINDLVYMALKVMTLWWLLHIMTNLRFDVWLSCRMQQIEILKHNRHDLAQQCSVLITCHWGIILSIQTLTFFIYKRCVAYNERNLQNCRYQQYFVHKCFKLFLNKKHLMKCLCMEYIVYLLIITCLFIYCLEIQNGCLLTRGIKGFCTWTYV